MGYETLSTSSATPRTVTPPRAAPIGQSFNDQPKGDPFGSFRINADQAANVIQMGASAPGYVMERPIAALDTLSGGGAKSAIDQAGDTIRGVPVLGDLLSGGTQVIGNVYEGLNRVTRAPVNAGMANALRNTANLDPHAKVDGLTAWLSGAGGLMGDLTVQQLRETAARRGFTKADIDAMVSGRKGILDFADKNVSDNPLVDLAGSLALDPTNYLTFGVAGAAAKGAVKIIPGAEALLSMSGIQKLATGMHGINEAVGISRVTAKGTVAGMMALRAGSIEGVTLNALSRHLGMMFRGSSDFLSGYRKVAYATTAGQIAAQAVGEQLPDNTPLSTLYEPLYKAAKAMGENKPLSQGGTWNLWAAINFPIRDDLSRMWSETRQYGLGIGVGKATVRTPLLKRMFTAEKDIIAELAPGMSIADGRRYLEGPDGFGSPEAFRDYLVHQTKSFYGANVLPRQNALSEAMLSTAEFSTKAVWIDRHIETAAMPALERGLITGRDLVQHIKDEHTGARSYELNKGTGRLEPKAGAVDEAWDPKEHIARWKEWTRRMDELHLRGGFQQIYGVVVGIADGALPKEWLRTGQAILKDIAREDGTIAKADMDRFLDKFPALTVDANDPSNFFARLRHPDFGEVHVDAAIQRLKKLEEDASSLRDYLYDVEQWEARAERIKQKRGRVMNERGEFDPSRAPDMSDGGGRVMVPTQRGSVRRALGAPTTYEDVLQRRGDEAVATFEDAVGPALDDLGFNTGSVVQTVTSMGGQKRAAINIHISSKDDPATILLAAGIVARHARAPHAIAIISGAEALAAHGLTPNAAHVRFDFRTLGGDEVDAVLEKLTDRFDGQFEYNDTAAVAHVIVREGQAESVQLLQRELAAIVGDAKARAIEAPAWVQVVNNDTRGAVRSGRTPAADVNASDIFRTHRTDIRYVNAASAFRTAVDERAGLVGQARPGFSRGPEYARAGSDDLGGDRRRGVTEPPRVHVTRVSSLDSIRREGLRAGDTPSGRGVFYWDETPNYDAMDNILGHHGADALDQSVGYPHLDFADEFPPVGDVQKVSDWLNARESEGWDVAFSKERLAEFEAAPTERNWNTIKEEIKGMTRPGESTADVLGQSVEIGIRRDFQADDTIDPKGEGDYGGMSHSGDIPLDALLVRGPDGEWVPMAGNVAHRMTADGGWEPVRSQDAEAWIEQYDLAGTTGAPNQMETRGGGEHVSVYHFDEDGVVDGWADVYHDENNVPFDVSVTVRPDKRRQGIATAMYDELAAEGIDIRGVSGPNGRNNSLTDEGRAFTSAYWSRGNRQNGTLTDEIRAADTTGTQGQVLWLAEKDDELANLMPKMGDDLRGLPTEEWAKVGAMEAELRRYDPQYRLKILPPDRNTPVYHAGEGNAIKDMVAVSQAASDLMYQKVWKPAADFQNALFGRVYTKRLADDAKQLLYGEILAKTAHLTEEERPRVKDIDSFLQTLDAAAQNSAVFGSQLYARGDALPPKTINEIASGVWTGRIVGVPKSKTAHDALRGMPVFRGFSPATLEALGGVGNIHKVLDRTGSRFYRDLRERTRGKGQLGSLIRTTYGMSRVATATPRHYIRTFYHLFRFTLDPRWHVLNRAEADILGYAKYGVSRFNGATSPEAIDNAVRLHGGSMVGGESDLLRDALASGILDARHLEGYIGRAFKKGRVNSTKDVIRLMAEEDPSIVQALQRFGGTPDEWTKGLENMMYEFDRKGVEPTIIDEAKKVFNEQQLNDLAPLITRLYERNNQVFSDAVSTFHGNTNRSNLERIMNSYFLFWPISYQLKATKWMFDVLTKQSVGRKTNFLGVWTLDRMYQHHVERLATDEGYQRMFVDNPALWQFAAMLLPVTPFDMGVSLSRFTRYSLAAGGFIEDKDFTGDPFNSALSLLKMGPLYTFTLAQRVYGQSQDRPKDLVVPIQTAA